MIYSIFSFLTRLVILLLLLGGVATAIIYLVIAIKQKDDSDRPECP